MEINKDTLPLIIALAAVIGGIVSAVTGALSALAVTGLSKRSEERKHFRELVVNTAYKNWERLATNIERTPGGAYMYPLDDFIILMSKTADLVLDKKLTADNIESKLEEISALNMKIRAFRDRELEQLQADGSSKSYGRTR
jgi:hypothetical protein